MKSLDMVIVVPVSGLTRGDEALRLQVWEKVTALLRPELGKLYRQFNPSGGVWEHRISRPFGGVVGKEEREELHRSVICCFALRLWMAAIPSCWRLRSGTF